jgi:hypothetical protein
MAGASLASGQAVRRLTLDQETEGSNPSSPASSSPNHKMFWSMRQLGVDQLVKDPVPGRRRRIE